MRKSLTLLEKRLAAYAVSAGVALAVAPAADAQVIYTDIEPDRCLIHGNGHTFLDIDGDGVDDFQVSIRSIFTPKSYSVLSDNLYGGDPYCYTCRGVFDPAAPDNQIMVTGGSFHAQALSAGATISSGQHLLHAYLYGALFVSGGGPWAHDNRAFVGLEFIADRAGAATTHYGWTRVSTVGVSTPGEPMICVEDYAYESTPSAPIHGGAIPVELVSFDAQVNGDDVVLNWETSSETNNAGFEVQMMQGEDWNVLGFVAGNGTTTEAQTYSFNASGMDVGAHTFRLKQIDFDGAFEYSPEVEATIEVVGTHQLSNAYPNPFNPRSQFTLAVARDQRVTAKLYNVLGQRVASLFDGAVEANNMQVVRIDGSALPSGAYIVRVVGETFSDALRVTLTK